ncbi:MAG: CBS domain-containing protein [Deltaproteobacteria bacterium]|nr:CBS domain-containing protein [Deltaproteobacteria bacterium]
MEVITTHLNTDFDAFASMICAKLLYPRAKLIFPGSQEKGLREYLVNSELVKTLDILKLKDINLEEIERIILVDTKQLSRIGGFSSIVNKSGVEVIVYDHHPPSPDDIDADIDYSQELGANTTLMIRFLKERGIVPSPEEATIMAIGIYEDTGSLLYPSTRPEDCMAMGELIRWGADLKQVSKTISKSLTPEQVDILDQLIKNAYTLIINGNKILITKCISYEYVGDFAVLVQNLLEIHSSDAAFALGLMSDRIYLVARSSSPQVNTAKISEHFGGGGHPTAAAATVKGITLEQMEKRLIHILEKEAKPLITAKDIMTFPVKSITVNTTIEEARQTLNRYNINATAVTTGKNRIAGIITRQIVSRALAHGLGNSPVKEYMLRDIKSVHPDAAVWEIRKIIIDENQRLLPVVRGTRVEGVITRTDLLRIMHDKIASIEGSLYPASRTKPVKNILKERLPQELYNTLKDAGELGASMGFNVYLVGGIVRDMLLRIDNLDIDLVVEGDGISFAKALSKKLNARVACHEKFKTAVITLRDQMHIDIATARLEYYNYPGDLPQVEESTLKLDLYRRDFTINTMAIALNPQRFGELIDYFGAQRDLKEKRIRVLHSLSFVEDPSRILRAIRFEQRFGFSLGKQTLSLVQSAIKAGFLKEVSSRRIFHELRQILSEENPVVCMDRLKELGILNAMHSDLDFNSSKRDLFLSIKETLTWFNLLYTHETVQSWALYALALIGSMKSSRAVSLLKSLGLEPREIRKVLASRDTVLAILKEFAKKGPKRPSWVARLLEGKDIGDILYAMARTKSPDVKKMISSYITMWRNYKPPVTGKDLISIGFSEGKELGECITIIKEKGLNGEIRNAKEALEFARKFLDAKKVEGNVQVT